MQIQPFPWQSLFLAPFVSVPAFTLAGLGSSDSGAVSDFGLGIFFAFLVAVPASFLGMLLIWVPIFLILRPYKYALMLVTCALGLVVPFLIFFDGAPFRTILMAVASGGAVAAAAWFLRPGNA